MQEKVSKLINIQSTALIDYRIITFTSSSCSIRWLCVVSARSDISEYVWRLIGCRPTDKRRRIVVVTHFMNHCVAVTSSQRRRTISVAICNTCTLYKLCYTLLLLLLLQHIYAVRAIVISWQSACSWHSHKAWNSLPLLSARPAVTFPAAEHHLLWLVPNYTACWQRHTYILHKHYSLSRVTTWKRKV